jgi:hypothetical protein
MNLPVKAREMATLLIRSKRGIIQTRKPGFCRVPYSDLFTDTRTDQHRM